MGLIEELNLYKASVDQRILNKVEEESISLKEESDSFKDLADLLRRSLPDQIIEGFGMSVTIGYVIVQPGSFQISGEIYGVPDVKMLPIDSRDVQLSRYDVVYVMAGGTMGIVSGELSETPVEPAIPDNSIRIGSVLITPVGETIMPPDLSDFVTKNTNQVITATKTFTNSPLVPAATHPDHAVNYGQLISGYVPFLGADKDLNMGQHDLISRYMLSSYFRASVQYKPDAPTAGMVFKATANDQVDHWFVGVVKASKRFRISIPDPNGGLLDTGIFDIDYVSKQPQFYQIPVSVTPPADSNDKSIPTTEWVKSAFSVSASDSIEYKTGDGTKNFFTDAKLIGKVIDGVWRDGTEYELITSGIPVVNQVVVDGTTGKVTFSDNINDDEYIKVRYKSAQGTVGDGGGDGGDGTPVEVDLSDYYTKEEIEAFNIIDLSSFSYGEPDQSGNIYARQGIQELAVNRDLQLFVEDTTPGLFGTLLIKMDATGFYNITLGARNNGNITIALEPNTITELTWTNYGTVTTWKSKIVKAADVVLPPAAVSDLNWNYLDAESVQISFTAPSGNGALNVAADRYIIYYSNAPITTDTNLDHLQVYKNKFVPKLPGSPEVFNLGKLTANQTYYIVVLAQKTVFGTARTADISNIIHFITLTLEGGGEDGNSDIMTPIDPENISFYSMLFNVDAADGETLDPKWLVDYGNITLVNGVPTGKSSRNMTMMHTDQFKTGYYNQEPSLMFDLKDVYTISKLFIYLVAGSDDKPVYTSLDGTNWNVAATIDGSLPKNVWSAVDLDPAHNFDVRYIRISTQYSTTQWGGIVFAGKRQSAQNLTGVKYKSSIVPLTLREKIGTNNNIVNPASLVALFAMLDRIYINAVTFVPDLPMFSKGAAANGLVTLQTMVYIFETHPVGNFDTFFKAHYDLGIDLVFCVRGMPWVLHPDSTTTNELANRRKPLDPGLPMTLANTTNPLNYTYLAEFYWQVAARYGRTNNQPNNLFKIGPNETIKKGLGYIKYFELGLNEPTLASSGVGGEVGYTNPEELAAIISACYDGHKGAMGPGFGIKDADPTAVPVMVALTAVPIGYKIAMLKWWDANRGLGDYPIKVYNEHYYNCVGGPPIQENTSTVRFNLYALPPEMGYFETFIKENVDLLRRTPALQNMPFWLTETGYDEHLGSFYAPKDASAANRGWKKALWTIRIFMMCDYWGVDKVFQYAVFSTKYLSELTNSGTGDTYQTFATAGYLDGPNVASAPNRIKTQVYYYSVAFQKALTGYKFSHAVRVKGAAQTVDAVTKTTDPDLYVFAYVPTNPALKPMLIFWLGNDLLTKTVNIDCYVTGSEASVNTLTFDDLHTTKVTDGTAGTLSSVLDGTNRKVTLAVTATPKIVYTANISKPLLIMPEKVVIQTLGTTEIKLVWTDRNIGMNNTQIYRSTDAGSGFVSIFEGYIDNASFVDTGLAENTVYYYQIRFENDGVLSETTTSYGIQTPKTIAVPAAFARTTQSPSSISLAWTYPALDAAYVDGFELWRSTEAAGTYVRVAKLPATAISYVDNGLTSNTAYFHKLRAYKGSTVGAYTATVNSTTDQASILPPALQSAETSYSGDRVTLKFSLPIDNPAGLGAYFTVVEQTGNRFINVIDISLNADDPTKVNLFLETAVLSTAKTLSFSYDGVNGTLQSIYGVKVAGINGQAIVNRLNDPTLLLRTMKVNFMEDGVPSNLADWNDYNLTGRPFVATQLVIPVKDSAGNTTPYTFTLNEKNPQSHVQDIIQAGNNPANYFSSSDAVNANFPVAVRLRGAGTLNATQAGNKLILALMKLDKTKMYNVRIYSWRVPTTSGAITAVQGNGFTGPIKTLNPAGNVTQTLYVTNLVPSNISLPAVSANSVADGYPSDKITVNITAPSTTAGASVQALIIEEVINN